MQLPQLVLSLLSIVPVVLAVPATAPPNKGGLPLVESSKLRRVLTRTALLKHADEFLKFSKKDPDGNRAFGGVGHKLTVDYLYNAFSKGDMAKYYTVQKQEFVHEYAYGTSKVVIEGDTHESSYFTYSPSTGDDLNLPLGAAANVGCEAVSRLRP